MYAVQMHAWARQGVEDTLWRQENNVARVKLVLNQCTAYACKGQLQAHAPQWRKHMLGRKPFMSKVLD